jgi:hypothetical protein
MDLAIFQLCITQVLDTDVEMDLDLCLVSHMIHFDAIDYVGLRRLDGNNAKQQGSHDKVERANDFSCSMRTYNLQYFSF